MLSCQQSDPNAPMNPEMAKNMIKLRGFSADEKDLFQAIRSADVTILKAFFDAGVSPNAVNEDGFTALTFAIQKAEPKVVKALIEKADINLQDKNSNSPIHLALDNDKEEIFSALLEKGADINVTGRHKTTTGQSVLFVAVIRNRIDVIQKLLEKGADPNLADSDQAIPLAEACIGESVKPEVVKLLLDNGAKTNLQEKTGQLL